MHPETQLHLAGQLLGHLLRHDASRNLADRTLDVKHSIDVAGELIRQWEGVSPTRRSPTPTTPDPGSSVRRVVVDRYALPPEPLHVDQWRAGRTKNGHGPVAPTTGRQPRLH